jgi:hypothetical protein
VRNLQIKVKEADDYLLQWSYNFLNHKDPAQEEIKEKENENGNQDTLAHSEP